MRIIAAIDLLDGSPVRLTGGAFDKVRTYGNKPLAIARMFEDNGLKYLHLVDLDGARKGEPVSLDILEKIASKTSLIVDYGGGIRSDNDIRHAFGAGASQVVCGSIAVSSPGLFREWLNQYGDHRIVLGADFKNRLVAINAWSAFAAIDIKDFLEKFREMGAVYAICTDIDRDGMLCGPASDIYGELCSLKGIKVIASGGITSSEDLKNLDKAGCEGAIIGKAVYEGMITLKELGRLCLKKE